MTPEEKIQFEELKAKVKALESFSTIPYSVDQAFRSRFNLNAMTPLEGSTKAASSENQSVNEAGVDAYSVLNPPDAFLQVTISGTTYYIPVFT